MLGRSLYDRVVRKFMEEVWFLDCSRIVVELSNFLDLVGFVEIIEVKIKSNWANFGFSLILDGLRIDVKLKEVAVSTKKSHFLFFAIC